MDGWMVVGRWVNKWMSGRMDEWWMLDSGWMDGGWMDEWVYR